MKRNVLRLILWVASLGLAHATPIPVNCPERLNITQAATAPDGWETIPPRWEPSLEGITVYDGPPKNLASQVPDEIPAKSGLEINRYFVENGFWLECRYHGTFLTIAKPLPQGVKTCHAYYKQQKFGLGPLVRFECE